MLGGEPGVTDQAATSLLYCGEQLDTDLQNYYLRARCLDQGTGRFNRVDPFGGNHYDPQSLQKYAYCHLDPVNSSDPTGLLSTIEMLVVTAVLCIIANIALTVYSGVKKGASAKTIALQVFHNLAYFVAIAGATFLTGAVASLAALVLFIGMIWGSIQLARNWPHMSTEDRVITVLTILTYAVFAGAMIGLRASYAGQPSTPSDPLDWSIVSKSGETRTQHIRGHEANNLQKPQQGVFYGDGVRALNDAWNANPVRNPTTTYKGVDLYIFRKPNAGYSGGYRGQGENLNWVTIITKQGSNQLITGFPSGRGIRVQPGVAPPLVTP